MKKKDEIEITTVLTTEEVENSQLEEVKDLQDGYLTLPFNENQFQSFIKSLLGTPQTINKSILGTFEIQMKDLQNFHDLINQRITQQNKGKLIQLKSKIYYSDQSSILLSSYEELVTYNEVKPILSIAIRMTWTYLIQFADKSVPEKQEIELMINSAYSRHIIDEEYYPIFSEYGQFFISIRHTARTWGTDIETLLTNQIKSILKSESVIQKYIRNKSNSISKIASLMFIIIAIICIYFSVSSKLNTDIKKVSNFASSHSNVNEKINYLLNYTAQGAQSEFMFKGMIYGTISIIVAIFLGIWIDNLAGYQPMSYLVLTREAKKRQKKQVEREKHKLTWFIASIFITIILGIVSNYIFIKVIV